MHIQSPLTSRPGTVKGYLSTLGSNNALGFHPSSSSPENRRRREKTWAPPRGHMFWLTVSSSSVGRSWRIKIFNYWRTELYRGYILVIHTIYTSELHISDSHDQKRSINSIICVMLRMTLTKSFSVNTTRDSFLNSKNMYDDKLEIK